MLDVNKKWALITGASRGLGFELALFMAKQGCNLILHSRSVKHTQKIEAAVRALGVDVVLVEADLADDTSVRAMLAKIDQMGMDVDIVMNNAGIQVGYRNDFFMTPLEDFDTSFKINFIAITTICYHFLPKMIQRGYGRIVNTTSGIRNQPQQAGYSASKAALDKFTYDLCTVIQGTDVIMSLTDPGWCKTDMGGKQAPNSPESSIPGIAIGAFVDDKKSGRLFAAQAFSGLNLQEALKKAEAM